MQPAADSSTARARAKDPGRRDRDRANILGALEACNGKVFGRGGAAELLELKPTTLAARIKALGIRYERAAKPAAMSEPV